MLIEVGGLKDFIVSCLVLQRGVATWPINLAIVSCLANQGLTELPASWRREMKMRTDYFPHAPPKQVLGTLSSNLVR